MPAQLLREGVSIAGRSSGRRWFGARLAVVWRTSGGCPAAVLLPNRRHDRDSGPTSGGHRGHREDLRDVLARLELLDAVVSALERHAEVGETIASRADETEAARRLQDLPGVSETAAVEVLNMPWRRWARDGQRELRPRRDEQIVRRDGPGCPPRLDSLGGLSGIVSDMARDRCGVIPGCGGGCPERSTDEDPSACLWITSRPPDRFARA